MAILTAEAESVRPVLAAANEPSWQAEIREAVRDAHELCRRLGLPAEMAVAPGAGAGDFPVFVPPSFLARIRPGDPHDPLLRQVLPMAEEADEVPGFIADPVGDNDAKLASGVLQKYHGRALLITTGSCAVHCRYCFRRHFPYEEAPHSNAAWDAALALVAEDSTITEVILSGGDPLMLVDSRLAALVENIEAIEHVTRLRIHTRLPIVVPARVTNELVAMLESSRLSTVVVIHANHALELAEDVGSALERLRVAGVMLLNQAVLLRGVNDSVEAQQALSERLIELGVVPYYLHQLDRVAGAAHFEVPIAKGRQIVEELRKRLPGYMVPRYVQEIPGAASKTVLL
jgi:EF-P beta-lysylation protein EpmB